MKGKYKISQDEYIGIAKISIEVANVWYVEVGLFDKKGNCTATLYDMLISAKDVTKAIESAESKIKDNLKIGYGKN